MTPVSLEGKRFALFPFTEQHITESYLRWLNDPGVNRFLEVRFVPQTRETALAYVRSFYGSEEKYMWSVHPRGRAEPIGTSTLAYIARHHGSGVIGLMIGDRSFWGKGASDEAIELIAQFAFERLGLRRLMATSVALNHGMNFTFNRLGFTLEGKLREACCVRPGAYADVFSWGLLAREWKDRRHEYCDVDTSGGHRRVESQKI